jgi:hypothetical protein
MTGSSRSDMAEGGGRLHRRFLIGGEVHDESADDFVITGASKEVLEEAKSLVEEFLSERGLSLSEEKTRIVRVEEGFDFLGWNVRRYDGHTHIKPAKKNVVAFMRKIRAIIKAAADVKQEYLIMRLNPVIGAGRIIITTRWRRRPFARSNIPSGSVSGSGPVAGTQISHVVG